MQSRNLFIFTLSLPPKMMSDWRSHAKFLLQTVSIIVSIDNCRTTKLILHKTLNLPVLLYGAEASTLLSTDAAALRVFERKVLRKIFGPSVLSGCAGSAMSFVWRRMLPLDVFDAGICGSRRRGRPCIRWKDQIEEALSSIGVTNWRRGARSRDAWKDVLRQAEIR